LKLPAASCRESSKCKELIHFIVVRSLTPQQAAGNALALLNFPKGTLFNGASWSIFNLSTFILSFPPQINATHIEEKIISKKPNATKTIHCGLNVSVL
jgi:hypothetical protein